MGVRGDLPETMTKDMYKCKFEVWDKEQPMHPEIFSVVNGSRGAGEKETQLIGAEEFIEPNTENKGTEFASPIEGWTFLCRYRTFKRGIRFSAEEVEDAIKISSIVKTYASTWTKREIQKKETVSAGVFNDGGKTGGDSVFNGTHTNQTDSSGDLMYDSIPFFALTGAPYTHKGGTTYFNSTASLALTPANFETTYHLAAVTNAYDEEDTVIKLTPNTLLTESGSNHLLAKRIMESEKLPFGQQNDVNVYRGMCTPMDWRYLDDTDAFYVGVRKHENMQFRNRIPMRFRYFIDEVDDSHNATARFRFGIWIKQRVWARGGGVAA